MATGAKAPAQPSNGGCAGFAFGLVAVAAVGWCASFSGGGGSSSIRSAYDPVSGTTVEEAAKQRVTDSAMVARVEATESPPSWEIETAETKAHEEGWPHDRTHERAARIYLSQADSILRAGGEMSHAHAATVLDKVRQPLTKAQSTKLTGLQRRQEAAATRAAANAGRDARRQYARELETRFLDNALDIEVTTPGANATTLRLEYVLFSRVWVHKIQTDTDMIGQARSLGFRRVVMTDGYDDTWTWDLTK